MPTSGFFDLGNAVVGGDIDRQGAFLEGLDTGSKINARRASTTNALAQARLRVDEAEARESLVEQLELGGNSAIAAVVRAGGNPDQAINAQLGQQEQSFREGIADLGVPFEQRQANAQAVSGRPIDPFQFGPGGDLFADVFNPGAAPTLSETGPSAIDADVALAEQRRASAALSDERRLHPDRFKSSVKAGDDDSPLAEQILPGGVGSSIIPDTINVEEAFGSEAFFKGGTNAVSDFIGLGTPFEDEAQANEVLGNLGVRTQIVMQARVPGRPSAFLLQLLGTYAENPRQLFRGDELATERLRNTVATLRQDLQRTKDALNSPTKKTPTRQGELEDALFSIADLVADYEKILQSLIQGEAGVALESEAEAQPGSTSTDVGGSFVVNPDG